MATASAANSGYIHGEQCLCWQHNEGEKMNAFGGLEAHWLRNLPVCTDQSIANVVSFLKLASKGKGRRRGGAFSSTCNAASQIFKIAAIMKVLVLVGVAVCFILLRIESSLEELSPE